jgi:molecular chaperone DnaK
LSDAEIESMVQEAKENEQSDMERKKVVEAKNSLDTLSYQAEKLLAENKENLSQVAVSSIQEALEGAKPAIADGDLELIESVTSKLNAALQESAKEMYANTQTSEDAVKPDDDDVIDAEFV